MTGHTVDVEFPIGYPSYMSPESILDENPPSIYHDKVSGYAAYGYSIDSYTNTLIQIARLLGSGRDAFGTLLS